MKLGTERNVLKKLTLKVRKCWDYRTNTVKKNSFRYGYLEWSRDIVSSWRSDRGYTPSNNTKTCGRWKHHLQRWMVILLLSQWHRVWTVTHKYTFKKTYINAKTRQEVDVHTTRIEGAWKHSKDHFKRMSGTKINQFEGHLAAIMWRSAVVFLRPCKVCLSLRQACDLHVQDPTLWPMDLPSILQVIWLGY